MNKTFNEWVKIQENNLLDRYTPLEGLEGPIVTKNNTVVYYDPKEGKYYNRDTDMYLTNDEVAELHLS